MNSNMRRGVLNPRRPSVTSGLIVSAVSIAGTTLLLYPLGHVAPSESIGIVFLVPVMLVSTFWGLRLGLLTAALSAVAYNFFHIPPTGRLTISEAENWVALGVLLMVAVIVSSLAGLARQRAAEAEQGREQADLVADLAQQLLGAPTVEAGLEAAALRIARALGADSASIELSEASPLGSRQSFPLRLTDGRVATLVVGAGESAPLPTGLISSLEAILSAAVERDRLQSEVVENEALRRSDEVKTALLRSASHDLRTPLTAIIAAGEALSTSAVTAAERHELADGLVTEARRLSNLVDKLLDLSRLQTGFAEPHPDWCSLEELLVAACAQPSVGAGRVDVALDDDLPLVRADAVQLERAFANLLENSVRHSGGNPVQVRGRVVGHRLLIRVIDHGPGLPETQLGRIFEPFYQAAGSANPSGSGLGLAIVKGFIEGNGGSVWAESLPGQGAVFVVEFPLELTDQAPDLDGSEVVGRG